MKLAVTIHLASGQSIRGDIDTDTVTEQWMEWEVADEAAILSKLQADISGAPRWCCIAGVLVYTQVVSAIEVETIGGSQ